ncbi:hypothetical protein LQ772_11640 [Frateuria edaphi]|uniref:hypothetical protein n=1 Tax=Frateuria edaphi TaxID=2898793 RepID=UPI001E46D642|nr:hypothetical protein [Frateuria edaphi]UGB44641.1 hypothetical protein LQ772_11640 [Frateuria edaphi]
MNAESISFSLLHEKVSQYAKETEAPDDRPGPVERWAFVTGCAAGGVGLVLAKALSGNLAVRLSTVALILELTGLATSLFCMFRREWRGFQRPHEEFSRELDQSFDHYVKLVASVRVHPKVELQQRLRYLKARRASLAYRTSLFSGSMDRLGVLPVLAVLYVQFKDWRFGDWASTWDNVHLVGGLILWALLLAYLVSWWLIRLRSRLDVYEALLAEALEER